MARGRFISRAIITDRAINEMSCDTSRLAFTWLITLADREGRTVGEPDLLKAALFPRRSDITPEQIENYISEWTQAGFIIWYYGDDGDRYIQLVNFEKHQVGLRKDREAASDIDAPDNCRSVDGLTPAEIGLRLRLSKGEVKDEVKEEDKKQPTTDADLKKQHTELYERLRDLGINHNNSPVIKEKWGSTIMDWGTRGVTPEMITLAVQRAKTGPKKYTISGPWSLESFINNLLMDQDAPSPYREALQEDMI